MSLPAMPILVTGAGGFIGSRLFKFLTRRGADVCGLAHTSGDWRLIGENRIVVGDATNPGDMAAIFERLKPRTVFHLAAYGAYSSESDWRRIHRTNYLALADMLEIIATRSESTTFIHAGSSSEYGLNSDAPIEDAIPEPNSHYAVSKLAAASMLRYFGRVRGIRCCNLRLYSVYGPEEDPARLIPTLLRAVINQHLPPFVDGSISRDFIHVDDVVRAFITAAINLSEVDWGTSFNIGTGVGTTIQHLAELTCGVFEITETPRYGTMRRREWDLPNWKADTRRSADRLRFQADIDLRTGLTRTRDWMLQNPDSPTSTGQDGVQR